jgi:hypothetical protein
VHLHLGEWEYQQVGQNYYKNFTVFRIFMGGEIKKDSRKGHIPSRREIRSACRILIGKS